MKIYFLTLSTYIHILYSDDRSGKYFTTKTAYLLSWMKYSSSMVLVLCPPLNGKKIVERGEQLVVWRRYVLGQPERSTEPR
jgi:hypothetical protein